MQRFISLFVSIAACAVLAAWFFQNPINAYWQQTYHTNSPLETLSAQPWWRSGAQWQEQAYAFSDGLKAVLSGSAAETAEDEIRPSENTAQPEALAVMQTAASAASDVAASDAAVSEPAAEPFEPSLQTAVLKSGDKVFFVGDSLMQGVAPFAARSLKKQYGIDSVDLSKQSTGLSYPKFFDWPKTVEQTLAEQKNIRLMVVFLGPNDPWDFPKSSGGAYLKFASPEWSEEYGSRVGRILDAADKARVQVIWLGIPFMKKNKLNQQMRFLDKLLSEQVGGRGIWIPTDRLLSNGGNAYADSVERGGKVVRYRSKDGIHFSTEGQKLLAEQIMGKIIFQK